MERYLTIGLLGCGVVGGGVADRLLRTPRIGAVRTRLGPVFVRDADKERFPVDVKRHLTLRYSDIIDNPRVDVVVECLGGVQPAGALVERALSNGKPVVTANKTLIATHGARLLRAAKQHRVLLRYEAAVGGAIPILRALRDSLAGEELLEIGGVINGTSNYLLSAIEEGLQFDAALRQAQSLGYAESDPSADIDGADAAQKLAILVAAAFGVWAKWDQIPRRGIPGICARDFALAKRQGYTIKLLAFARRNVDSVSAAVTPAFVPFCHIYARPRYAENLIRVVGRRCGALVFSGAGAGRDATASAILGDLTEVVKHVRRSKQAINLAPPSGALVPVPDGAVPAKIDSSQLRLGWRVLDEFEKARRADIASSGDSSFPIWLDNFDVSGEGSATETARGGLLDASLAAHGQLAGNDTVTDIATTFGFTFIHITPIAALIPGGWELDVLDKLADHGVSAECVSVNVAGVFLVVSEAELERIIEILSALKVAPRIRAKCAKISIAYASASEGLRLTQQVIRALANASVPIIHSTTATRTVLVVVAADRARAAEDALSQSCLSRVALAQ